MSISFINYHRFKRHFSLGKFVHYFQQGVLIFDCVFKFYAVLLFYLLPILSEIGISDEHGIEGVEDTQFGQASSALVHPVTADLLMLGARLHPFLDLQMEEDMHIKVIAGLLDAFYMLW